MLRQRNGLSDSLLCKTKTKAQCVPAKNPVPTSLPDGTGRFCKQSVVKTAAVISLIQARELGADLPERYLYDLPLLLSHLLFLYN